MGSRRHLAHWALATASASFALALGPAGIPAASATSPSAVPTAARPCGVAHARTDYRRVVWILLENVGYSVVGSPDAPYLDHLAALCGLATDYHAVSHPSLPNYIALTSGSTQGIADDNDPVDHPLDVPSIFSQLGGDWRTYAESMPGPCFQTGVGEYAPRHNPAVYYTNLGAACARDDLPLPPDPSFAAPFTVVVPNLCDDMHSCPVAIGDAWLRRFVPEVLASPEYRKGTLVLAITFDENDAGPTNRVPTYVLAPSVPRGLRVGAALTHYSLLRTTEQILHLAPLGAAASAPSMLGSFHL